MRLKTGFSLLSALLGSAVGVGAASQPAHAIATDPDFLIIHGVVVQAGDSIAATTVAIVNQTQGEVSLCSGSIIAPDLIVTAGHCVGPARAGMRVVFSTDLTRPGGTVLPVAGYVRPKDFGERVADEDMNDIALIRIEGALPPGYHPAQMLGDPSLLKNGEKVTLAGYGVNNGHVQLDPSNAGAGVLRKVDVSIAQAVYGRTEVMMDQSHGHGACHGDSGGPAFLKQGNNYLLFGVTSRGTSAGADECAGASIYTSILAHARFISDAAAGLRRGMTMP